jgi:hypothetical protein
VPTVPVPDVRLIDDSVLVFGVRGEGGGEVRPATLEPDFHLREFHDFDANDPQQVLTFCRQWGPVGTPGCNDLHAQTRPAAIEADDAVPFPWRLLGAPSPTDPQALVLGKKLGFWNGLIVQVHSVARVAYYQAALSNAVEVWRHVSGKTTLDEVVANWRPEDVGLGSVGATREDTWITEALSPKSVPLYDLSSHLNPALVPFHVRLEPYYFGSDTAVNIYQAACLQLANDIAERVEYGRCANEKCARLFSRQRGRTQSEQYRKKGVLYCSTKCARAQAQRQVRRRRKGSPSGNPGE